VEDDDELTLRLFSHEKGLFCSSRRQSPLIVP
jgi:hypothetical protein